MFISNLNNYTRILCKKLLDYIVTLDIMRLICKPPSALAKVISSNVVIKPPAEISCPASIHPRRIISCTASKQSQKYCGSFTVGTSLPIFPRLCAKAEPPKRCSSKTEINMIEACVLIINKYWRNHLTNIAHFTTAGNNDGSWRDNLVSIRILLGQRK